MNRLVSFWASGILLVVSPASLRAQAWYMYQTWQPSDTVVAGLALPQIDTSWAKASLLSWSNLGGASPQDLSDMRQDSYDFVIEGDFNGDTLRDRAVVGVYAPHAGPPGRFLLILTEERGTWRKALLRTTKDGPGFSVLSMRNGALVWGSCMWCDCNPHLSWQGGRYEIEWDCPEN